MMTSSNPWSQNGGSTRVANFETTLHTCMEDARVFQKQARIEVPGGHDNLRRCTFCTTTTVGDKRHCAFDCPPFQGLQQQHAEAYQDPLDIMRSFMWHKDQKSVCALVLVIVPRPRHHNRLDLIGFCWLYGRNEFVPRPQKVPTACTSEECAVLLSSFHRGCSMCQPHETPAFDLACASLIDAGQSSWLVIIAHLRCQLSFQSLSHCLHLSSLRKSHCDIRTSLPVCRHACMNRCTEGTAGQNYLDKLSNPSWIVQGHAAQVWSQAQTLHASSIASVM